MAIRLAVLGSGRGSNLQAVLDAIASGALDARVVGVFSDRPAAPALQRVAAELRWARAPSGFPDRAAFDAALADAVAAAAPDWVLCAGYMRLLGEDFVARFRGRMLNIHPSLLPRHRGLRTHARALAAGDAEHGASVHFVTPELDAGGVVLQAAVPVLPGDDAEALAARVLAAEHPLLVRALQWAAAGRISERDGRACLDGQPVFTPPRLPYAPA
jgi:phosphoribosylglycinamide formyltransferase-1